VRGRWARPPGSQPGSTSFLKKRSKKLLHRGATAIAGLTPPEDKSFLLLFFKKELLLLFPSTDWP
jgi:hypothetical protein